MTPLSVPIHRTTAGVTLTEIESLDAKLLSHFSDRLKVQRNLTRQLVSFQANKERAGYRWFKYKEAYSAALVEHFLDKFDVTSGPLLDPFAGMGTSLFAARSLGLDSTGIELLPIGREIIDTRLRIEAGLKAGDIARVREWSREKPWRDSTVRKEVPTLRITAGAYPAETLAGIEGYLGAMAAESDAVRAVLRLALLCVLESVSYTRKDGQYLRWDHRSGRKQGKTRFDKGEILAFDSAVVAKLNELLADTATRRPLDLFTSTVEPGQVALLAGSCLDVLPRLEPTTYRAVITSPPYCNRYDYTRTYALELAILDVDKYALSSLRQQMLSCTVENRAKELLVMNPRWATAVAAADASQLLQLLLRYLEEQRALDKLNNPGIARMVRGYFYEMACVICECARVLVPGGRVVMVNDNVRYAGASVSVDLILSEIAERVGLTVENILVLPSGKGNSSQQMGAHGRDQLRKCVYVWRKE